MKLTITTIFFAIIALTLSLAIGIGYAFRGEMRGRDHVPEPRLISPITTEVDLTGRQTLEFKWSPHEGDPILRDYYDFRLYKGYDMLESTLLFKQNVDKGDSGIVLKSGMFENDQTYTWSVKQIYTSGAKSRRSFASFKAINSVKK